MIDEKAAMFFFVSDAFRVMWAEHGREIRVCALEVFLHGRFWFVCRLGKRTGRLLQTV